MADRDWVDTGAESRLLKVNTLELLKDWGAFLDVYLYREALVYLLGGPMQVCRAIEIFSGPRTVGMQNLHILNDDTAFAITSKPRSSGTMRDHLQRLLNHTRLNAIQWINLNRHVIEFTTLSKEGSDRIMAGQNHKPRDEREPGRRNDDSMIQSLPPPNDSVPP